MDVFIGWSGEKSRTVALALHGWLPNVIQQLKVFVSEEDIGAGSRWGLEIDERLDGASFGIICLTEENKNSTWVHYEAGSLAKNMSSVVPLLIDLGPADLQGPLTRFHATRSLGKEDMSRLVEAIHDKMEAPAISERQLEVAFDQWWPLFREKIADLPKESDSPASNHDTEVTESDVLTEVLDHTRTLMRRMDDFQRLVPAGKKVKNMFVDINVYSKEIESTFDSLDISYRFSEKEVRYDEYTDPYTQYTYSISVADFIEFSRKLLKKEFGVDYISLPNGLM